MTEIGAYEYPYLLLPSGERVALVGGRPCVGRRWRHHHHLRMKGSRMNRWMAHWRDLETLHSDDACVWWLRGNETYTIGWCRWLVYGILCGFFYLECFNFVVALEGVKWGLRGEWDCNYITSWRLFDPFEGSRGCQLFLGMAPWLIGHILMG